MFNLLDIVRQAQGGAAIGNLARQFGLPADQAQRAVEALLPAFAIGLERNAALNPFAFAQFLQAGRNPMLAFFEGEGGAAKPFTPRAEAQGAALLGPLFGSPDVSRGVVEQASAISGVSGAVLRQMMPILAGLLVAGLVHAAMNTDYGALFSRYAEAWRNPPAPPPKAPPQDLFSLMLAPMLPPPPPPPPPPPTPLDTMGRLFEAGREVQEQHLKTVQSIFDAVWGQSRKS